MPITTLTEFHHWLLAEDAPGAPFVVLQSPSEGPIGCAPAVARLLNEFDEESGGNWIALTPQIIHAIAADAAQRRLLGVEDTCGKCPPTSRCGLRKVVKAIAQRGHVVFDDAIALEATEDLVSGFIASLGVPAREPDRFHIILNPSLFHSRCLAPLVADSFLEWKTSRKHLSAA